MDSRSRRIAAVTTCHRAGFEDHGRRMIESWQRRWPGETTLTVYTEGFDFDPGDERVAVRDLLPSAPGLVDFKARHAGHAKAHGRDDALRFRPSIWPRADRRSELRLWLRRSGYRWDAVRFAHKAFALFHAARHSDADVLIWLDADTVFFADVSLEALDRTVPRHRFVGYLHRPQKYSETGFVAWNLRHPATPRLLDDYERMYTEDRLFAEREFHDAHLFDVVRRRAERRGHGSFDIAAGIGSLGSHVLVNSPLGAFMDHLKGDRKAAGVSRPSDHLGGVMPRRGAPPPRRDGAAARTACAE